MRAITWSIIAVALTTFVVAGCVRWAKPETMAAIQEAEAAVKSAEAKIAELEAKVDALQKEKAEKEAKVKELEAELASLKEQVEKPYIVYRIKKGDTLKKIALQFYGDEKKWKVIYEYNKDIIKDPDLILPCVEIRIPKE